MKKSNLITILILSIVCLLPLLGSAQNDTQHQNGPQAVINYKTPQKINPLIEKVNELTDGDAILTELVIYEISKIKTTNIHRVVQDEDFNDLSSQLKKEGIKQSEVIEIINRLKK